MALVTDLEEERAPAPPVESAEPRTRRRIRHRPAHLAPRRTGAWLLSPAVLASYLLLVVIYFAGAWAHPAHRVVGSPGDPSLFIWYLGWVPWAIAHGHNPLLSTWVNAPHGVNLMWNTSMLLPGLVLAPLTEWWGALVTYNVLVTAGLALSGWTAWLALRKVCGVRAGAAWLGGLVFAFSPFMVAQAYGHLHLVFAFLLPLLAVAVHEIVVTQHRSARRGGLVLGVLAGAQFLTGEELLAIAAIALGVAVVVAAALSPRLARPRAPHAVRAAFWAVAGFVIVAGFPLAYQYLGPQSVHGPVQPRDHYVADLLAPVTPTSWQWLHPWGALATAARFQSHGAEWCAYLGVPLIALMLAGTLTGLRRRGVLVATATAVVLVVFSFGPHLQINGHHTGIWMPWSALGWMSPLDSLLPVRLMIAVDLIAAGMIAVVADAAWTAIRNRRATGALLAGATALVVVSLLPAGMARTAAEVKNDGTLSGEAR